MPVEIERKFLMKDDGWRAVVQHSRRMVQGYLAGPGGKASMRVRISGTEARFNIKAAVVGAVRAEYDWPVPLAEAAEILATLAVGRVEKTRHYAAAGNGRTWEIDEFDGDNAGLVVAEIELGSLDEAFERPAWLGREVTDDARYYNHALALQPWRSWPGFATH
ncbi:MAG: CYTH domain-containing protein [Nevskiaceae bacterium]|nr:MAG: CYTH domain-containing protein [Nevskiaceae bacterium]TBR74035.1 MAG: CYTH domain-containing protein [Nevskiaceae bacterium]